MLRHHLSIERRSGMACPEPEASFIRMLTFWEGTLIWLARFRVDRNSSSPCVLKLSTRPSSIMMISSVFTSAIPCSRVMDTCQHMQSCCQICQELFLSVMPSLIMMISSLFHILHPVESTVHHQHLLPQAVTCRQNN